MNSGPIRYVELDRVARRGLPILEACFDPAPDPLAMEQGKMTLKLITVSNGRIGAETNRLSKLTALAKFTGVSSDVLLPVLADAIEAARTDLDRKPPEVLTAQQSQGDGGSSVAVSAESSGSSRRGSRKRRASTLNP